MKEKNVEGKVVIEAEKILALFERGDNPKSAQDVAGNIGIRSATPKLRRVLERLTKEGKLKREVRECYDSVYSRSFGGPVACLRKRAYYEIA